MKLENDLFYLKKDKIACTAQLDGKNHDLLARTVPPEKCHQLDVSTVPPRNSSKEFLEESIRACTAPPEGENKKNLLAGTIPPEN